jgi:amino acid transporter
MAIAIIVFFTVLNCFSVHFGGGVQTLMTAVKILMIIGLAASILAFGGAIQSDALTLRIFVIRLVGSDLRASLFCRTWLNRPPNRRFYG